MTARPRGFDPNERAGVGNGALKDRELMAPREVLERDDSSAGEEGAKEGLAAQDGPAVAQREHVSLGHPRLERNGCTIAPQLG